MSKQIICTALAAFFVLCIKAQSFGEIHGKVLDPKGEPIPGAMVLVSNNSETTGIATDENGRYRVKPLKPGKYDVMITMTGLDSVSFQGLIVNPDLITFCQNATLSDVAHSFGIVHVTAYMVPLIQKGGDNIQTLLADDLLHRPTTHGGNLANIVSGMSSDFKPAEEGGGISVRGSRENGVLYFIDGVKVRDNTVAVPASGISSVSVYTGGIPAKYGDTTGGVVIVNTKSYTEEYYKKLNQ